jgi:P27 family predicted phage terminase small subunit
MNKAPANLSKSAQAAWPELVEEFCFVHDVEAPGASDLLLLEELLHARDRLSEVRADIQRDGLVVAGSKGQSRPHPLLATERALERQVEDGLERLWLTPRHRQNAELTRQANDITRWDPKEADAPVP